MQNFGYGSMDRNAMGIWQIHRVNPLCRKEVVAVILEHYTVVCRLLQNAFIVENLEVIYVLFLDEASNYIIKSII